MADRNISKRISSEKVRDVILDYIHKQGLEPGDKLLSDRALVETLGLTRRAVTNAVEELVSQGRLERRPRSGTYIAYKTSGERERSGERTIAVLMPWLAGRMSSYESTPNPQTPLFRVPFGSESMTLQIMHGIVAAANRHSARIVTYANNSPEEEKAILRQLINEDVSGVIVMPRRELTGEFGELAASGKPFAFIDHYFADLDADRVVTANKDAAKKAVEYLIKQGHRRIAFFTSFSETTSIMDREAGYREALSEAGIEFDEDIARGYEAMRGHRWGYDLALEHCARLAEPVTAVFCVDDFAVERTMEAAGRLGLEVPNDLSVAGFFEYQLPESIPIPFTRVVQDKFTIGETAASLVLGRLTGEVTGPARHIEVPAALVPAR